ncbi:SH3 domain-containing protein [Ruegeria faecimaris]|uniref:SH3-like domain-containing protein n=1 Tax=Ruegeria faecimaris TaxID=686389 RepID=A0A521EMD8_9RHOB|nr:SH3-like domain-containing protein [Ruegeria faecimaris]
MSVLLPVNRRILALFSVILLVLGPFVASAQDKRGQVTNLPLPRYVSMKAAEGNVRRGPSLSHRIDWVFKRRGMPLQVTAEYGNWRKVQDRDGAGGWVHYALLSGVRTVLIESDLLPVYSNPDPNSQVSARFETGVVARLGTCTIEWCRISAGGYRGWALKSNLWGVDPSEIRE